VFLFGRPAGAPDREKKKKRETMSMYRGVGKGIKALLVIEKMTADRLGLKTGDFIRWGEDCSGWFKKETRP